MKLAYLLTTTVLVANGVLMLLAPETWYRVTPDVGDTGPLNVHFVRDIGVAYLVAGVGLFWRAVDGLQGWPAALAGAAFLLGHALVHLVELVSGHGHGGPADWLFVYAAAGWVAWLALPGKAVLNHWLKPVLRGQVSQFEAQFDYDAAYMHEMLDDAPEVFLRFGQLAAMATYRESIPAPVWHAAKITAAISEDCGPCTQLAVTMAANEGVPEDQLNALVCADEGAMNDDVRLGFAYASNVINHSAVAAEYIEAIENRWGRRAIFCLAMAIAVARVFPMVKYGVGHGQTCMRVSVGDLDHPVDRSWLGARA